MSAPRLPCCRRRKVAKARAPSWTAALAQEFIRTLPSIEYPRRRNLLTLYTSTFNTPGIAPMLESVLDEWKPGDNYEGPREALYALHKTDPARARARIRAELVKEKTWLDAPLALSIWAVN